MSKLEDIARKLLGEAYHEIKGEVVSLVAKVIKNKTKTGFYFVGLENEIHEWSGFLKVNNGEIANAETAFLILLREVGFRPNIDEFELVATCLYYFSIMSDLIKEGKYDR